MIQSYEILQTTVFIDEWSLLSGQGPVVEICIAIGEPFVDDTRSERAGIVLSLDPGDNFFLGQE